MELHAQARRTLTTGAQLISFRNTYRDFITVALVVPEAFSFPDNWSYLHEKGARVGRIQNFGSWSPYLVKDGRTCLGLEYFVNEGDELWTAPDQALIALASREVRLLGLVTGDVVEAGYVVRMPKAYPVYDVDYDGYVQTLRAWIAECVPNVHPVGQNGMHKYNNQDHSMLTGQLTVKHNPRRQPPARHLAGQRRGRSRGADWQAGRPHHRPNRRHRPPSSCAPTPRRDRGLTPRS